MIQISFDIDDSEVRRLLDGLEVGLETVGQALYNAGEEIIEPRAQARSISVWNIRTGRYAASWYTRFLDPLTVEIGNDAPYSHALETGWTTRGGGHVSSPGVLFPVALESIPDVVGAVEFWLSQSMRG